MNASILVGAKTLIPINREGECGRDRRTCVSNWKEKRIEKLSICQNCGQITSRKNGRSTAKYSMNAANVYD